MNNILEELKEESKIIKEETKKRKYIYIFFIFFGVIILLTAVFTSIFSYINLKFDLYDKCSWILKILLCISFIRGLALLDTDITKVYGKTIDRFFEIILIVSINLIPNFDFTKLTLVAKNMILIFIIIVVVGIFRYFNMKNKNLFVFLVMLAVYFACKYEIIYTKNPIVLEGLIFITSDIFDTFTQKIKKYGMNTFNKKYAYSYMYLLYSLYILMFVNLKL